MDAPGVHVPLTGETPGFLIREDNQFLWPRAKTLPSQATLEREDVTKLVPSMLKRLIIAEVDYRDNLCGICRKPKIHYTNAKCY